ncbi:MAG: imidazole glycerol phosphate synthase subunit HisH [Gemmatimonas sp.]
MRVTILDYGAGNLHSLEKALVLAGARASIEADAERCLDTDALVLPGVGAFGHAATRLAASRDTLRSAIRDGLPTIGICLGMHLLFDGSDEGPGEGLGVVAGRVERLATRRIPQIGWNSIDDTNDLLVTGSSLISAYYANSFVARPADDKCVVAWSTHESDRFPAIVRAHRAIGVQFHPEKSSAPGIRFLAAALAECAR